MTEREVVFERAMHSSDAIQRAAYVLSDRLSCDVTTDGDDYRCAVYIESDVADEVETTLAELRKTVLDETLRERVRSETESVRNLILALAFSNTGLVDASDA